jgi:AraC-like DNA-binding protein
MEQVASSLYFLATMAYRDLVFLHSGFVPQCIAQVDKHFDGYHTLQFMTEGRVVVSYDAREHLLDGGWYWPAFPGPRIRMHLQQDCASWVHRYVAFKGPLVSRWQAEGLLPGGPQKAMPPLRRHAERFDLLLGSVRGAGRWATLRAVSLLETIVIDLAAERASAPEPPAWHSALVRALEQTRGFTPDYERIARECGLGLRTLRRRFRELGGTSLHRFVVQQRLTHARGLLSDTETPIKAVAQELGYDDVFFFTKQFKKHWGVTPGQFRRSRQR